MAQIFRPEKICRDLMATPRMRVVMGKRNLRAGDARGAIWLDVFMVFGSVGVLVSLDVHAVLKRSS